MMSQHILDLCWLPYFYNKDAQHINFSRFYLLWVLRYQHLCDFSHFKNVTITSKHPPMCEFFPKLEIARARPKISPMDLPVSSINSVHINI